MADLIRHIPLRSPTLPPATHTNAWVVGRTQLTVIDPASPWPEEQARLLTRLKHLGTVNQIVLTHHHPDHIAGAVPLQEATGAEIFAHPVTAERLPFQVSPWLDREIRDCGGVSLTAYHTPGHAPGHLVFFDAKSGSLIAGDMVAGIGTIAIDPSDGHLQTYLDSLAFLQGLQPDRLLPAHGPILDEAAAVLEFYIAHRHSRSDQIRRALDLLGSSTPLELVPTIYPELPSSLHPLGATQISSHLIWLAENGLAIQDGKRWQTPTITRHSPSQAPHVQPPQPLDLPSTAGE